NPLFPAPAPGGGVGRPPRAPPRGGAWRWYGFSHARFAPQRVALIAEFRKQLFELVRPKIGQVLVFLGRDEMCLIDSAKIGAIANLVDMLILFPGEREIESRLVVALGKRRL